MSTESIPGVTPPAMPTSHSARTPTARDLFNELQALALEAKKLMSETVSENSAEVWNDLRARFDAAHARFDAAYEGTRKNVVAGARCTDASIREHPYQALAIALGVGVALGVLVGRSSVSR